MKLRYMFLFLLSLFLTGCSSIDAPISYAPPSSQYQVQAEVRTKTPIKEKIPVDVPLSNDNTYTNSAGNEVHSPAYAPSIPAGASAICRDGTYSFSKSRRGTCSRHGGVSEWL